MSTLEHAVLGALSLAALAVFAPGSAEASSTTNNTATWCKTKGTTDSHIISDSSSTLVWKTTGELVLEATNHIASKIWSSGTANQGNKLCFESDGDLSIYNAAGTKLWSQAGGSPPSASAYPGLDLKYSISTSMSDCDLSATYSAQYIIVPGVLTIAASGTLWTKTGECAVVSKAAIAANWCADNSEEKVLLREDWSQLVWKPAGFLALVGSGSAAGTSIWQTPTSGAGKKLCFETDGELVIYDVNNAPIWRTGSNTTVTPAAGLYATVSAGVGASSDVAGAVAGIRGSLTLIELSLPIAIKVSASSSAATYSLTGSLELDSLSGSFELFAEAYVKVLGVKIGVDWSTELFSWDGISWSKSLFSKSGSF